MKREFTCIVCPNGCRLHTEVENGAVTSVTGNRCPKGRDFAEKECTAPTRSLCTTVKTLGGGAPVLPVRTAGELPKERLFEAMAVLNADRACILWRRPHTGPFRHGLRRYCHGRLGA